jgi:hypothetical protein
MSAIFEQASRGKVRFPSDRGDLTVEQLWDLPLQAKNGFDLDSVAKDVNCQLKAVTEESFVNIGTNPAKPALELKLDIVKHIIATRIAENEAARTKAERLTEKRRLVELLGDKNDEELKGLSKEELTARIAALG